MTIRYEYLPVDVLDNNDDHDDKSDDKNDATSERNNKSAVGENGSPMKYKDLLIALTAMSLIGILSTMINLFPIVDDSLTSLQFVHIPKNGGSYVENLAAAQDPPLFFGSKRELRLSPKLERPWKNSSKIEPCSLEFNSFKGRYVGWHDGCCSWWHIPPRMFTNFDSSSRVFAILRNPIERAISEERWENKGQSILPNETVSSRIRESVQQRLQDPTVHDCHFLEQYLYVTDTNDDLLPNMDILCFEKLDGDLRERFPGFTFLENIDQNESPKHGHLVLEPEVIDVLRSVYARDFELHEQFCS